MQLINQYNQLSRLDNELIHVINELFFEFRDNNQYNKTAKTLTTADIDYFKTEYDSHGQPIKQ